MADPRTAAEIMAVAYLKVVERREQAREDETNEEAEQ